MTSLPGHRHLDSPLLVPRRKPPCTNFLFLFPASATLCTQEVPTDTENQSREKRGPARAGHKVTDAGECDLSARPSVSQALWGLHLHCPAQPLEPVYDQASMPFAPQRPKRKVHNYPGCPGPRRQGCLSRHSRPVGHWPPAGAAVPSLVPEDNTVRGAHHSSPSLPHRKAQTPSRCLRVKLKLQENCLLCESFRSVGGNARAVPE